MKDEERKMKNLKRFMVEEDGMGSVEVVLIIIVLIALVAIFKDGVTQVMDSIVKKMKSNANAI